MCISMANSVAWKRKIPVESYSKLCIFIPNLSQNGRENKCNHICRERKRSQMCMHSLHWCVRHVWNWANYSLSFRTLVAQYILNLNQRGRTLNLSTSLLNLIRQMVRCRPTAIFYLTHIYLIWKKKFIILSFSYTFIWRLLLTLLFIVSTSTII